MGHMEVLDTGTEDLLCRWKIGDHPETPWLEPDPEVNMGRTSAVVATGPSVYNGTFPANVVRLHTGCLEMGSVQRLCCGIYASLCPLSANSLAHLPWAARLECMHSVSGSENLIPVISSSGSAFVRSCYAWP